MLPISIVVEVDALDSGVRLKCVFVQEDSTTSIMGNVEVIREALVLEVPNHVAISPQCVLQWHFLCLVEAQDSSSRC